jgi:1-acyl-sn-glycerol-3-phosphate acyltransferase
MTQSKSCASIAAVAASGELAPQVAPTARNRYGSIVWFFYLLAAIVFVGLPGCTAFTPIILLGRLNKPLRLWTGRASSLMIRFMFYLNYYWLTPLVKLNFPEGFGRDGKPYILVSNHRSHLDAFFLLSWVPGVRMLAKQALFFLPGLGLMMFVLRQIPVRSKSFDSYAAALERARKGLRAGDIVHVFPEATRCPVGFKGVQRFIPGIFQIAMQEGVSIIPIVFKNTDLVWPKGSLRFAFRQPIAAVTLDPINPRDFSSIQNLLTETKARIEQKLAELVL